MNMGADEIYILTNATLSGYFKLSLVYAQLEIILYASLCKV